MQFECYRRRSSVYLGHVGDRQGESTRSLFEKDIVALTFPDHNNPVSVDITAFLRTTELPVIKNSIPRQSCAVGESCAQKSNTKSHQEYGAAPDMTHGSEEIRSHHSPHRIARVGKLSETAKGDYWRKAEVDGGAGMSGHEGRADAVAKPPTPR